jgi:flagellar biogenesis protein FliO
VGRFIILIFLFVFANASSVLNISYFPLNDKIDILFSLDKPFNGKIISLSQNSYKITNINLDRIEQKKFPNSVNIIISPLDENSINLKLNYKKPLNIKASVTAKGYGLRIRILGLNKSQPNKTNNQNIDNLNTLNTNNSFNFINYMMVIAILIFLIIILIYVKKKTLQKLPKSLQEDNYKVLYQKMIDPKNRIVMIEIFNKRYLLLLGDKNNILLDNFSKETQEDLQNVSSQNEFGQLIDERLKNEDKINFIKNASKLKETDEF